MIVRDRAGHRRAYRRPSSASNSVTSQTDPPSPASLREVLVGREEYVVLLHGRPHPAVLTAIVSTPAASKACTFRLARSGRQTDLRRGACSAPQHP